MSDLRAITGSYEQIDSFLKDLRERHDAAGEPYERDRVAREQEINDQAYFVLAWEQLETDIDEACRTPSGTDSLMRTGAIAGPDRCTTRTIAGSRA